MASAVLPRVWAGKQIQNNPARHSKNFPYKFWRETNTMHEMVRAVHVTGFDKIIRRKEPMKATGIVRRIDDLGRVVIPKEIRRTMRIREGDPLEIFTDNDGEVVFKSIRLWGRCPRLPTNTPTSCPGHAACPLLSATETTSWRSLGCRKRITMSGGYPLSSRS